MDSFPCLVCYSEEIDIIIVDRSKRIIILIICKMIGSGFFGVSTCPLAKSLFEHEVPYELCLPLLINLYSEWLNAQLKCIWYCFSKQVFGALYLFSNVYFRYSMKVKNISEYPEAICQMLV